MISNTEYYNDNSQEFFQSTVNADMTSLYMHFLKYIPDKGTILDFGCGSGRDTKAFIDKGYKCDAIDGSSALCRLASEFTGIEVKCMDFMSFHEKEKYNGIWACASLLHIHSNQLPGLLTKMRDAVIDNGVIYVSFKYGDFEGERNGRYFVDMTEERIRTLLSEVDNLSIIEEWYSEDVRQDNDTKWYSIILRKG